MYIGKRTNFTIHEYNIKTLEIRSMWGMKPLAKCNALDANWYFICIYIYKLKFYCLIIHPIIYSHPIAYSYRLVFQYKYVRYIIMIEGILQDNYIWSSSHQLSSRGSSRNSPARVSETACRHFPIPSPLLYTLNLQPKSVSDSKRFYLKRLQIDIDLNVRLHLTRHLERLFS